MTEDLKKLVKSVAKNDLMSGIVLFLILVFLGQYNGKLYCFSIHYQQIFK